MTKTRRHKGQKEVINNALLSKMSPKRLTTLETYLTTPSNELGDS